MKKTLIIITLILTSTLCYAFDFDSITKSVTENLSKSSLIEKKSTDNSLQNDIISKGLKEALNKGVLFAVEELGSKDGYLKNPSVKIPLPDNLAKAESTIKKLGGEKITNDLIYSMNKAATQAAPETVAIFLEAIKKMDMTDAQKILLGDNTAATDYFQKNTTKSLSKLINPIVQKSMKENDVIKYYETANSFYKSNLSSYVENSSTMKYAKNFGIDSYLPSNSDKSLDEYVTEKTMNGLFKIIAQKEYAIRKNPVEQSSAILKKVFGK